MSPLILLAVVCGTQPDAAAGSVAWPSPSAPARYFFTLFAGQSVPFRPRTAHTWATWTKVTPSADGLVVEPITISWLPASGVVRPFRLRAVAGENWSLEETLAIMARYNSRVSRWGPYEVTAENYRLALEQYHFLESGAARYRVVDSFNVNKRVVNCVHAVTHASPYLGNRIQPVIRVGEPGTSRLAAIYLRRGALVGYPVREDWVLRASGGGIYPTVPRQPGERIRRYLPHRSG